MNKLIWKHQKWRVKSRQQWQSTEDWQIDEPKSMLKLLTSESDSFTLYMIGLTDFWTIMSGWSDDILNKIIKKIDENLKQNKEERKRPSFTATNNNRRNFPENSKISELFIWAQKIVIRFIRSEYYKEFWRYFGKRSTTTRACR